MKLTQRIQSQLKNPGDVASVIVQLSPKETPENPAGHADPRHVRDVFQEHRHKSYRYYPNLGLMLGRVDRQGLETLAAHPAVGHVASAPRMGWVRPRQREQAHDLSREIAWGLQVLGAPDLWKQGLTGRGVAVAHLDTGCDATHPTLVDAVKQFVFFDDHADKHDRPAFDEDGHGTHTAGTIAGRVLPSSRHRIGMAPRAELHVAKVIGDITYAASVSNAEQYEKNSVERVLAGMDWAVGAGVRIINMSMGFEGFVDDFLQVTKVLRARGVLPVFAIGNEGADKTRSPGNYLESLSVGACDQHRRIAHFSSSQWVTQDRGLGPKPYAVPDIVAPGVEIESAKTGGGYEKMAGTSMATPHISGLAALLFEAKPEASVDEVEEAIVLSCTRSGCMLAKRAGFGMPNASAALAHLLQAREKAAA